MTPWIFAFVICGFLTISKNRYHAEILQKMPWDI
jgi:hypothetical protein